MSIQWDESMRTGDDLVDQQHQELIRQINLLHDAMQQGHGSEQLNKTMQFLAGYVKTHFHYEEECMSRHHCPAAEANKAAHQQFLKMFSELQQTATTSRVGASMAAVKLLQQLGLWLSNHIKRVDRQLHPCIHGRH
jgi:hemerythrin-like metal-binding protein